MSEQERARETLVDTMDAPVLRPAEVLAKIKAARAVVSDLCSGRREWVMSIPARPLEDPDIVISDALDNAARLTGEWRSLWWLNDTQRAAVVRYAESLVKEAVGEGEWIAIDARAAESVGGADA